jgi:acetylornithine deacetylase
MSDLSEKIAAAVAAHFEEETAFLERLVAFPSLRGAEQGAQRAFADACRVRGLTIDVSPIDLDAISRHPGFSPVAVDYADALTVIARSDARTSQGRSLVINGHMDVVPAGPEDLWSTGPFTPRREGDWLYGRGAGDMKAGLVAALFALDALRACGLRPAATLWIQSVVEEESTGNGALDAALKTGRPDAVLIPEPMDEKLVRANLGVLWFRIRVRGRPVHVRDAGAGANAIEAAHRLIAALRAHEARANAAPRPAAFRDAVHPINFNPGVIRGGDWPSSVPAWCEVDCRLSFFPGQSAADAMRAVEATIAEATAADAFLSETPPELEWTGFAAEGYVLEPGSAAEAALGGAHAAAFGAPLGDTLMHGYLDARVFALYQDTPTLTYGPIAKNIHGFDERVNLPSLQRVTNAMALFIAEWCGVEPVDV